MNPFFPILFLCLSLSTLSAQSDTSYIWESKLEMEVGFAVASPLADFRRNVDRELVGFNTSLLVRTKSIPSIFIGMDVSHFEFARVRADYFLNYDGFLEEFDVRSRTNLLAMHGKIRIAPPGYRKWLPYVEGMIGTKYFGTRTTVYQFFDGEYEEFDGYRQQGDWALSYGGAAGLIRTVKHHGDLDISAHLRVAYMPGAGATYLNVADDYDIGTMPEDPYNENFSTTNLLLVQIGVTFALGKEIMSIQ